MCAQWWKHTRLRHLIKRKHKLFLSSPQFLLTRSVAFTSRHIHPPHHFHTLLCSFPCSLSMSHMLSCLLFHTLLLSHVIPLFQTHTHIHTNIHISHPQAPSLVNMPNSTGSVAEAQGPLLSADWLWKCFSALTNWYLQSGEIWLCLD